MQRVQIVLGIIAELKRTRKNAVILVFLNVLLPRAHSVRNPQVNVPDWTVARFHFWNDKPCFVDEGWRELVEPSDGNYEGY